MPAALPSAEGRASYLEEARSSLAFASGLLSGLSPSPTDVGRAFADLASHAEALAWLSVLEEAEWKVAVAKLGAGTGRSSHVDRLKAAVTAVRKTLPTPREVTEDDEEGADLWPEPDMATLRRLSRTNKGAIKGSYANLITVLRSDPRWAGLRMNGMGCSLELDGKPMEEGPAVATVAQWVAGVYPGLDLSPTLITTALVAVASERVFFPMREYLAALKWDGVPRIARIPSTFLGIDAEHPEAPLYGVYTKRFLISAVARAMQPGCKVDTALILVGKQGAKKSTLFDVLFGEWFADSPINVGNKDAFINLSSAWGYEASELESLTARTVESVKQFLSGRKDTYRPPFGRIAVKVPRHSVLCGTTNKPEVLADDTGHRRFWIITVPDHHVVPVADLRRDRDHLWAEAVALYSQAAPYGDFAPANCRWWFDRDEEQAREGDMMAYRTQHPWEETIAEWVKFKTDVKIAAIYTDCLKGDISKLDARAERDIAKCLRALGWETTTVRDEQGKTRRIWKPGGRK